MNEQNLSATPTDDRSRRHAALLATISVSALAVTIACGSTSTTGTGPTPQRCELSLSVSPASVPAAGGGVTVAVNAPAECDWNATENVPWLSQMAPTSGRGNGQITLQAAANGALSARQDSISVNGVTQIVRQDAGTCSYQLSALSATVTPAAQTTSVTVAAIAGCQWTAVSNAPWVTVSTGSSGNGDGTVTLAVAANTSAPSRQGTVTIAQQTFTVTQGGAACTYSITPTSQSFEAGGGSGSAQVTAPDGCDWSATSAAAFVNITTGASGTGNGSAGFAVSPNSSLSPRQGTLNIAGQTFTVTQAALSCSYSISPGSISAPAAGLSDALTMTTPAECGWSIASTQPWITFGGAPNRIGPGTVNFTVQANASGTSRAGALIVGGETFSISQEAAECQFSIGTTSQNVAAGGGTGSVAITATAGCGWTATSNANFISVTSGGSGTGNGTTGFSVAANTGAGRSGTLTIAGHTFTVNQAAGCSFTIAPTTASLGLAAGSGTVAVTAPDGCDWSIGSPSVPWLTVAGSADRSGSGTVTYNWQANTGPARSGTILIAGQTFTANQSGCTYAVTPPLAGFGLLGGTQTVTVTAPAGCGWSVTNDSPSWLTITSATSGSGNGSFAYSVAFLLTGGGRTALLTVGDAVHTVVQNPPMLNPDQPLETSPSSATSGRP